MAQDATKRPPGRPRQPQEAAKGDQDATRRLQDALKTAQEASKTIQDRFFNDFGFENRCPESRKSLNRQKNDNVFCFHAC